MTTDKLIATLLGIIASLITGFFGMVIHIWTNHTAMTAEQYSTTQTQIAEFQNREAEKQEIMLKMQMNLQSLTEAQQSTDETVFNIKKSVEKQNNDISDICNLLKQYADEKHWFSHGCKR
jgi:septal ring factor EnvC (AmiA/AmiB activator)